MTAVPYRRARIVGAGPCLGASLARAFTGQCGLRVAVAARRREPLEAIAAETGAPPLVADASKVVDVGALFEAAALALGGAPEKEPMQRTAQFGVHRGVVTRPRASN